MTGGQLMAAAERRLGPYWSMTRSQVYRELPVLADMGFVRLGKPGPRSSQPYAITASGKRAFSRWLAEAPGRDALRDTFIAMARWLKPGGVMSHQIDFSCPAGHVWNHHWAFGDLTWTIIRGKRPYYVNRAPQSEYVKLAQEVGMDVVGVDPIPRDGLTRAESAARFKNLPEDDFHSAGALLIAVKR